VTKVGKLAIALVLLACVVLGVVIQIDLRDSTDAQGGLAMPFLIFWTALALAAVAFLDYLARTIRRAWRAWRDIAKPS
jgi:hypothetical protein